MQNSQFYTNLIVLRACDTVCMVYYDQRQFVLVFEIFVSGPWLFMLGVPMELRPICHVVEGVCLQCKTRNFTPI